MFVVWGQVDQQVGVVVDVLYLGVFEVILFEFGVDLFDIYCFVEVGFDQGVVGEVQCVVEVFDVDDGD